MASQAEPVDLDVLEDASEAHPPAPRRSRRRRWPWIAAAVVVIVGIVAFPVRARLAVAQLHRLDARWQIATELDRSRAGLITQLRTAATPDDADRLAGAINTLDDELAGRLRRIERAVASERIFDPGMRRLAGAERRALVAAVAALHAHRYGALDDGGVVARRLEAERHQWNQSAAQPGPHASALTSADGTLGAFQTWFDQPTGSVLVVPFNRQLLLLDVDHSRAAPLDPRVDGDFVLARRGYLAVLADGIAKTVVLDGTKVVATHDLGQAQTIFAASDDDAVWVVQNGNDATSVRTIATKVDVEGHELARWVGTPAAPDGPAFSEDPAAETAAGLLVVRSGTQLSPTLQVVPLDGSPAVSLTNVGFPFSADRFGVAWIDNRTPDHVMHLWSALDRTDRVVPDPPGLRPLSVGAVSPDGRSLVAFYVPTTPSDTSTLAVIDVSTTTPVVHLAGPLPLNSLLAGTWSPDGKRLWFSTRDERPLTTYLLGDATAHQLRAHGFGVPQMAAIR